MQFLKRNLLWVLFIAFAIMGVATKKDASVLVSLGLYSFGKYIIWALFFSFLGYTIYCSNKENFFKSIKRISEMYWGAGGNRSIYRIAVAIVNNRPARRHLPFLVFQYIIPGFHFELTKASDEIRSPPSSTVCIGSRFLL